MDSTRTSAFSGQDDPGLVDSSPGSLLPHANSSTLAPLTEAAFSRLPSQLDLGGIVRRRADSNKDLPGAIEDCAVSFANGQAGEALKRLETALISEKLGVWTMQAWLMRFDLYAQLDMRDEFEREAIRFATLFERSPPLWPGEEDEEDDGDDLILPSVAVTGFLSAESEGPLSALRKTVERYQGVRLDFTKLENADNDGCRCLLVTAQALRHAGKVLRVANEQRLLDIVMPHLRCGDQQSDPMVWLLALEILQARNDEPQFEDLEIQYATTFEVSPPSWQGSSSKIEAQARSDAAEQRFQLEGEVVQPLGDLLDRLEVYATQHTTVVVDLARVTRIDFISCSQITNVLAKAERSSRRVEIRSPNEMVGALLVLMGTPEFATIVPRR